MKYIRTIDEIFELFEQEKRLYGDYISTKHKHYRYDCVVMQADNIEELCDAYVAIGIGGTKEIFIERSKLKLYEEHLKRFLIFGAIWTIKGLIFVAKMDWKGEWELYEQNI